MADTVDWNALAADVLANFEATGHWFATGAPPLPEPVDWNALAAQVEANFAATGLWFTGPTPPPSPPPPQVDWNALAAQVLANFEATGHWFVGEFPPPSSVARISVAADGTQGNGPSVSPAISADGDVVAFWSTATNFTAGENGAPGVPEVFVKNPATGALTLASASADGVPADNANGLELPLSISADGRFVAFDSNASNLVPGVTIALGHSGVFVKDLQTGAIVLANTNAQGVQADGGSFLPSLSADGRHVAFLSDTSNLIPGQHHDNVYVKDLQTGTVTLASVSADGLHEGVLAPLASASYRPSLSADGHVVAFASNAPDLVPGDTNAAFDVFVKDLTTGQITRASTSGTGEEAKGFSGVASLSAAASLSADGHLVAFSSDAANLVPGDTNGTTDIFVKNLQTGALTLVSADAGGDFGNGFSIRPSLSPDGSKVIFYSDASNLVPGDTNGVTDAFVKDLATGAITRVSTSASGEQGNAGSFGLASLSSDGAKAVFASDAGNLVPGDTNEATDVFVHSLRGAGVSDHFALG